MGNVCSCGESDEDNSTVVRTSAPSGNNFRGQGQVLGSASAQPQQPQRRTTPAAIAPAAATSPQSPGMGQDLSSPSDAQKSPGRTLGSPAANQQDPRGSQGQTPGSAMTDQQPLTQEEESEADRMRKLRTARFDDKKPSGPLGQKLEAQKKRNTLDEYSSEVQGQRRQDATQQAMEHR